MKRFLLLCGGGILTGLSVACALIVVVLISMLERYSKDINEVIVTWFYIALLSVESGLSGAIATGAFLAVRGIL